MREEIDGCSGFIGERFYQIREKKREVKESATLKKNGEVEETKHIDSREQESWSDGLTQNT